jgi:hypothetical protein
MFPYRLTRRSILAAFGLIAAGGMVRKVQAASDDDYEESNGVRIYKDGKKPPLPPGLKDDIEVISFYGFLATEEGGKWRWVVGTEADYREAEAKRLKIKPSDVVPKTLPTEAFAKAPFATCFNTGPMSCSMYCSPGVPGICRLMYFPPGGYYYCSCS